MTDWLIAGAFLALPYTIYALFQTLRGHSRPNLLGMVLAVLAVLVPTATFALDLTSAASQPLMSAAILLNAVIVLLISGVIMVRDYRAPERHLGESYGTLGLGISVLLIVSLFSTPLLLAQIPGGTQVSASDTPVGFAADSSEGTLRPAGFNNPQAANVAADAPTQNTEASTDSPLLAVVAAETGLASDELLSQLDGGSTLAELVAANGGNLDAVTAAVTQALEAQIEAGTLPAQMLDRMGGDAATIAAGAVNGDLPPMILNGLLGGTMTTGAGRQGNGSNGGPPEGFTPPNAAADADTSGSSDGESMPAPALPGPVTPEAENEAASPPIEPTSQPATVESVTLSNTNMLPTPTPFMFDVAPTATPVVDMVAAPETEAAVATCEVVVNFNLNFRTGPAEDENWLATIPAYTTVTSTGQNADGWWQVTYDDETGWVSGDYVTADRACAALPVIE